MKMTKIFIKSLICFNALIAACVANGAENGRSRASMMSSNANASRMPTIPIVTMNTIGNPAVNIVSEPKEITSNDININPPTPTPPTPPVPPVPEPECADGGVANTDYTVAMCMNDLQLCVNGGGVEGGLHGLFNDMYFNNVLNGNVRICQSVVDKCLTVRKDCRNVFLNLKAVWATFRSRILWPEYYNFILYKTGLTPNQAQKTCIRLGGRWDAVAGDCIVCVKALNKNTPIKNNWLFGIAGDNRDAEACMSIGSSFTCNKDLFGFSLLNDTATVAATAIPGGAIVGGVIGGVSAKAKQNKLTNNPCESKDFRKKLGQQIQSSGNSKIVKSYLFEAGRTDAGGFNEEETAAIALADTFYNMDETTCNLVMDLYAKAALYDDAISACKADADLERIANNLPNNSDMSMSDLYMDNSGNVCYTHGSVTCVAAGGTTPQNIEDFNSKCLFVPLQLGFAVNNSDNPFCNHSGQCRNINQIENDLKRLRGVLNDIAVVTGDKNAPSVGKGILVGSTIGAATGGLATGIVALVESNNIRCVVGNNLASVALNKSYKIDSLKDFYVKNGFNLMDSVLANTPAVDKNSWAVACSEFQGNQDDCQNASVIYKHDNKREVVPYACSFVGSMCLVNEDIARLFGVQ